jgi:hypothetical protein
MWVQVQAQSVIVLGIAENFNLANTNTKHRTYPQTAGIESSLGFQANLVASAMLTDTGSRPRDRGKWDSPHQASRKRLWGGD